MLVLGELELIVDEGLVRLLTLVPYCDTGVRIDALSPAALSLKLILDELLQFLCF